MLICKQKINVTHFFLKMLQRNSKKTCYFEQSGHVWPHKPKMIVSFWRHLWRLSAGKKSTSSFTLPLRYCKYIANLFFWVLSTCRKFSRLSTSKKSTSSLTFFWRYRIDMQISYFGYLGHTCLCTLKMKVSTCRKLQCWYACQK